MPRIAVAGFQHETNSFSPERAELHHFEMADSWPGLLTGSAVIAGTQGMNLPIAGFIDAALAGGATVAPILWCSAEPSGPVTREAFETICGSIIDGISQTAPVDGIFLDLHGAMITEDHDDGEGTLLARIRSRIGLGIPIAVSLDMHANISARMVELADVLCVYRTYPHLDMAETGQRTWRRLQPTLSGGRVTRAFRQADFLVPAPAQHTGTGPARDLYAALGDHAESHVELALGFTAGDVADCGPSIIAHAPSQQMADALADGAADALRVAEPAFDAGLIDADEAVARAMAQNGPGPVVLADVQDNPGAGASSDTTGLLRALVRGRAQSALLGLMHDPDLAHHAHAAGEGAEISGAMGGRGMLVNDTPFEGRFAVEHLSDGQCRYTGAMYGGGVASLGPSAVLRIIENDAEIRVVVTSNRNQCLDQAHFTHFGLDPTRARIVCVKSTVHFRADFEPMASRVLNVSAPGGFPCRLASGTLRNLRPGVRLPG